MLKRSLVAVLVASALICGAQDNLVKNGDFTDSSKLWGGWGAGKEGGGNKPCPLRREHISSIDPARHDFHV